MVCRFIYLSVFFHNKHSLILLPIPSYQTCNILSTKFLLVFDIKKSDYSNSFILARLYCYKSIAKCCIFHNDVKLYYENITRTYFFHLKCPLLFYYTIVANYKFYVKHGDSFNFPLSKRLCKTNCILTQSQY